jgi:tetratricopeptide (TPR) repeat protein
MTKRILSAAVVAAMIVGAAGLASASPADDPAEVLMEHAKQLKKDKKFDEALEFYDAAVKIAPRNVEALVQKSWVHNELGQHNDAISAAEAAIKIDAKNSDAWCELGYAQHKTKKLLRAKESLDNAIKFDSGNETAKGYLKAVLKDLGED